MKKWCSLTILFLILLGLSVFQPLHAAEGPSATVFAAASTTNALNDIAKMFTAKGLGTVTPSYASSSTLARQIEAGAPADVFISADEPWMDYLQERKLIDVSSRFNLLGNSLVLIAPKDSTVAVDITPKFKLAALIGDGKLSTGDPDHVPAGKYAKAALEKLGVWSEVEGKLARASDVRGALALVERGEAPLGIVYSTDAAVTPKVRIVAVFPEDSHPKIVYPAALVANRGTKVAQDFFSFLKTPEAREVFKRYGFIVP